MQNSPVITARIPSDRMSTAWHSIVRTPIGVLRRLPAGGIWACLFIVLMHITVSRVVYPHPIAREPMRRKVLSLTQNCRPGVLIAGDCRATYQIRPDMIASAIGLEPGSVINVGTPGQTPAAVLAAYREFSERLAPHPTVIISISVTLVNDTVAAVSRTNELLWSLNILERFSVVSARYAITATFLPERTLLKRGLALLQGSDPLPAFSDFGFEVREEASNGFDDEALSKDIDHFRRDWVVRPKLNGVAWRQIQTDLRALLGLGVQVVVLDTPLHPALMTAISGTPAGETCNRFRTQLSDTCRRLGIPLLAYDAELFAGHDPDELFFEVTQLNPSGAVILSEQVGNDLGELFADGVLRLGESASSH